jgi:hypothetical protein
MKKEATSKCKRLKSKTSDEIRGNPKSQGAQIKDLWWKKSQPQNAKGSNLKPLMKKEATPKCKGLKPNTSNENRGNPKMQGAQIKYLRWKKRQSQNVRGSNQRPSIKKEVTPKCKGPKSKTSDEKKGNPKTQGAQTKNLRWKKRQLQNTRGSKPRRLVKPKSKEPLAQWS